MFWVVSGSEAPPIVGEYADFLLHAVTGVVFWLQSMRERVKNACSDTVTATKCVISVVLFFNWPLTAGENE